MTACAGSAPPIAAPLAADPDAWLQGHGWDSDRWGGWPTADDFWRGRARAAGSPSGRTTITRCG